MINEQEAFTLNDLANEIVRKRLTAMRCSKNCSQDGEALSLSIKGDRLYCPLCETDDEDVLKVSLKSCVVPIRSLIKGNSKIESYCDKVREEITQCFKTLRTQFDQIEEMLKKKCTDYIRLGGVSEVLLMVKKSTYEKQNLQMAKQQKDVLRSLKSIIDVNTNIKRTNVETLEKEQSLNVFDFISKFEGQIKHFFSSLKNNQLKSDQILLGKDHFKEQLLKDSEIKKAVLVKEDHYRKLSEELQTVKNCQSLRVQKTSALLSSDLRSITKFIDCILEIEGLQTLEIFFKWIADQLERRAQ